MIKRILLPFDGSDSSEAALKVACSLAGIVKAELIGLFVEDERRFYQVLPAVALAGSTGLEPIMESPLPADEMLKAVEEVELESRELSAQFAEACAEASIQGQFISQRGTAPETIISMAKSVDFVVIGNKGLHSGLPQGGVGLTLKALLHATTRPVLVVPGQVEGANRVVIAYDGRPASERVLKHAAEFAEMIETAEVHLLMVHRHKDDTSIDEKPAVDFLSAYDFEVVSVHRVGSVPEEILKYVREHDASILALGAFSSRGLKELIFGSTTEAIIKGSPIAVFLVA